MGLRDTHEGPPTFNGPHVAISLSLVGHARTYSKFQKIPIYTNFIHTLPDFVLVPEGAKKPTALLGNWNCSAYLNNNISSLETTRKLLLWWLVEQPSRARNLEPDTSSFVRHSRSRASMNRGGGGQVEFQMGESLI